ncbi:MAG: acetyl-CoA C-acyltransferase [Deltaproteobacteria bacterium]|nr:acetyl-CoA C-acyltransferase [Deltaproteobacteria bacterium]
MEDAVIVSSVRTAVGKAPRGTLRYTRPDDMGGTAIKAALERAAGVSAEEIGDVVMGCAMPEGEQGMNVARVAATIGGLPNSVPAYTVNRFCSSGLQAIAIAAERIMIGADSAAIGGGLESMSLVPMGGNKIVPNPKLVETYPDVYIGMGHTAEAVAQRYEVSRREQDEFAVTSHQKAAAAIAAGKFKDEIVALDAKVYTVGKDGRPATATKVFDTDEGVRADTSLEGLSKLRPAFHPAGSVTAGNSSQTSDGAAASVLLSAKRAKELSLKPLGIYRAFAVAGCDPDVMGIGPALAIPKLLEKAGVKLEDVDLFEINEAFASQALYVVRDLGLDEARVNVNGGAVALGHPLGCTGAKLTATLLHEMGRRQARCGVISMCIGGGMGAAGLFERPA